MQQFRSRVSVLILLFIVLTIVPVFLIDSTQQDPEELQLAMMIMVGSIGVVLAMLFLIRYEVDETHLRVRLGPIPFGSIKLSEIVLVERSYNPLSSPASSLKRLSIETKTKSILISPANEEEFIRLLKARNPKIKVNVDDRDDWWRFWDWDI